MEEHQKEEKRSDRMNSWRGNAEETHAWTHKQIHTHTNTHHDAEVVAVRKLMVLHRLQVNGLQREVNIHLQQPKLTTQQKHTPSGTKSGHGYIIIPTGNSFIKKKKTI